MTARSKVQARMHPHAVILSNLASAVGWRVNTRNNGGALLASPTTPGVTVALEPANHWHSNRTQGYFDKIVRFGVEGAAQSHAGEIIKAAIDLGLTHPAMVETAPVEPQARIIIESRPYVSRSHGGRQRYDSPAVIQRTWSDLTVDYACSMPGCEYAHDSVLAVLGHYTRTIDHRAARNGVSAEALRAQELAKRAEKRKSKAEVVEPELVEPEPKTLEIVSEEPYIAHDTEGQIPYESEALLIRRWSDGSQTYVCKECRKFESNSMRSVLGHYKVHKPSEEPEIVNVSEVPPVYVPASSAEQIIAEIRRLVGDESVALKVKLVGAEAEIEKLTAELEAAKAEAQSVTDKWQALRELIREG
jgi:hypothetical protein